MFKFLCSVALLVSSFLLPTAASATLVAHYTGDGTAEDSTVNNHDGTLVGDTTFATGQVGQAFSFDGDNDYITIPNDPTLEPGVISVTAWVNLAPTGGDQKLIVDSSHGFVDQRGWALQTNPSGTIAFIYGNGLGFEVVSSSTEIDDNTFHHVAGILDGTNISLYVDGILHESMAFSGTPSPSGRTLRIGASWNGNPSVASRDVNGLIDDVRIYDHALSLSDIRALAIPEPGSFAFLLAVGSLNTLRRRRRERC